MAGMSRDKIGASNVAGFMKVVSMLKPSKVNNFTYIYFYNIYKFYKYIFDRELWVQSLILVCCCLDSSFL